MQENGHTYAWLKRGRFLYLPQLN